MRLLILNGPNLNLLGSREVDVYGGRSLDEIADELCADFTKVEFRFVQDNNEGALIDALQQASADGFDGAVFNPGGYAHTSVALRDAIAATNLPVVEVHISNVHAREEFRRDLLLAPNCRGVITGLGTTGYSLAVRSFVEEAANG